MGGVEEQLKVRRRFTPREPPEASIAIEVRLNSSTHHLLFCKSLKVRNRLSSTEWLFC